MDCVIAFVCIIAKPRLVWPCLIYDQQEALPRWNNGKNRMNEVCMRVLTRGNCALTKTNCGEKMEIQLQRFSMPESAVHCRLYIAARRSAK